jgi:hypothetical protein
MLRISVERGDRWVTMKLEGKVLGPWVEECHRVWQGLGAECGAKKLLLDLRGVTFMNGRGIELLREIQRASRAEVVADSPLTKCFAEQIMRESENSEEKGG